MKNQKNKRSSTRPGQIRIIGGQWRGRKLSLLDKQGLRPTTDRARETLFNWLMFSLKEAHCLDCFAGSGALAFEALSRQAGHATLLERDPDVVKMLKKTAQNLNTSLIEIIEQDTLRLLAYPYEGRPYNIVFVDPPFGLGLCAPTLHLLEENHWLADDAWIYVESEIDISLIKVPANWFLHRERLTSQVACRLFHRKKEKQE